MATEQKIQTVNVTTKEGHTLQLFYNPENDLVVLDLIHKNDVGGNEILRRTLDAARLLRHVKGGKVDRDKWRPAQDAMKEPTR